MDRNFIKEATRQETIVGMQHEIDIEIANALITAEQILGILSGVPKPKMETSEGVNENYFQSVQATRNALQDLNVTLKDILVLFVSEV